MWGEGRHADRSYFTSKEVSFLSVMQDNGLQAPEIGIDKDTHPGALTEGFNCLWVLTAIVSRRQQSLKTIKSGRLDKDLAFRVWTQAQSSQPGGKDKIWSLAQWPGASLLTFLSLCCKSRLPLGFHRRTERKALSGWEWVRLASATRIYMTLDILLKDSPLPIIKWGGVVENSTCFMRLLRGSNETIHSKCSVNAN